MLGHSHIVVKQKNIVACIFIFLTIFFLIFSVSCSIRQETELIRQDSGDLDNYLIIWAHSDIQPYKIADRIYYENAIEDINSLSKIDIALVAGDIVNWSKSDEDFKWYIKTKERTSIKYWYEIAGNHDQKNYKNYKKYINMPLHYSVRIGNMILLCLSDESRSAETDISDEAFNWWKDLVISNQDKIIITMTHGYLKQSRLLWTIIPSRNIRNSQKFAEVLKNYKVDLWICGHTHLSHSFNRTIRTADDLNGMLFINVSAIRGGMYNDSESFLLFFKRNTDELIIKSRNHSEKKFDMDDISYKLSKKFQWDNSPPVVQAMIYDIPLEK